MFRVFCGGKKICRLLLYLGPNIVLLTALCAQASLSEYVMQRIIGRQKKEQTLPQEKKSDAVIRAVLYRVISGVRAVIRVIKEDITAWTKKKHENCVFAWKGFFWWRKDYFKESIDRHELHVVKKVLDRHERYQKVIQTIGSNLTKKDIKQELLPLILKHQEHYRSRTMQSTKSMIIMLFQSLGHDSDVMHALVVQDSQQLLDDILKQFPDIACIDRPDSAGYTQLYWAVQSNKVNSTQTLLSHNADICAPCIEQSAWRLALHHKKDGAASLVCRKGKSIMALYNEISNKLITISLDNEFALQFNGTELADCIVRSYLTYCRKKDTAETQRKAFEHCFIDEQSALLCTQKKSITGRALQWMQQIIEDKRDRIEGAERLSYYLLHTVQSGNEVALHQVLTDIASLV